MKTLHSLLLIIVALMLISCGKDDDNNQGDPLQINLESNFAFDLQEQGILSEGIDEYVYLRKFGDLLVLISDNRIVGFNTDGEMLWERSNNYDFGQFTEGLVMGNNLTLFSDLQLFNTKLTLNRASGSIVQEVDFFTLLPTSLNDFTKTIIGSKIYIFGVEDFQAPQHRLFLFEYEIGSLMANEIMSFEIPGKNYGGISRLVYDEVSSSFFASFTANKDDNTASVGLIKMDVSNNSHEIFELFEVEGMAFTNERISLLDRSIITSTGDLDIKLFIFDIDNESLLFSRTSEEDFDQFLIYHFTTEANDLIFYTLLLANLNTIDLYYLFNAVNLNIETLSESTLGGGYYMIGQNLEFHNQSATIPLYPLGADFSDQFISQIHFVSSAKGELMGYFDVEEIENATGFISNLLICNETNRLFVVDDNFNLHSFNYPF